MPKINCLFVLLFILFFLVSACQPGLAPLPAEAVPVSPVAPSAAVGAETQPVPSNTPVPVSEKTPLIVFCAGSLILPFADLEEAFEAKNPGVDVLNECHGSIQVIRHVTDLQKPIDVVATADHALIPMLMYPILEPESGQPYASWYLRFAGNRLAIGYTNRSRFADQINLENWYEVIARPEVRLGIADPRFDASGYRALMALKLAERYYHKSGIFNSLIQGSFRYPLSYFDEEGLSEISVPEIVEPISDSGIVIRGSSIQLIALLQSGDLDYAFEYESVLHQHQFEMAALPDPVNLGSLELSEIYRQVQVNINFQRFASVKPVFRGEPIGYGITIPVNAPHPEIARRFIGFILGEEGRRIMTENFHPILDPMQCDWVGKMPQDLQGFCKAPISQ